MTYIYWVVCPYFFITEDNKMDKFTVNGKVYFAPELDFDFLSELDMNGIESDRITGPAAISLFLAYCSRGRITREQASKEISQHVINGGTLADIVDVYKKKLEDSDFFRAIMEQAEKAETEMEETETEMQQNEEEVSE